MFRPRTLMAAAAAALTAAAAVAAVQAATKPVWATPDRFWFRVTVPGGYEWWSVDAEHGVRERLFDHRRLAIELSAQSKEDYTALSLPFAEPDADFVVKYDGVQAALEQGLAIEFNIAGDRWRCELHGEWDWARNPPSDYYCAKKDDTEPVIPSSDRVISPDGKWEAMIEKDNVAVRPVGGATKALSTDGTSTTPYHLGSLRWSSDSRRLSGYRVSNDVWRLPPTANNVKKLVSRMEWMVGFE